MQLLPLLVFIFCLLVLTDFVCAVSEENQSTQPSVEGGNSAKEEDILSAEVGAFGEVFDENEEDSKVISSALKSFAKRSASTTARMAESGKSRGLKQVVEAKEQGEGRGARVRRAIGNYALRNLDPFLMLDEFNVSSPAGFPDHPHRGFETVTYMLEGAFTHKDFKGHHGTIGPGDLQWMTAGKGIVHSEMPATDGKNVGLQLWVNLPAKQKLCEPNYQELKAEDVPEKTEGGVKVKVIAGKSMGIDAAVLTQTPIMYLDFTFDENSEYAQEVPEDYTGFAYVIEGEAYFGKDQKKVTAHHVMELDEGDSFPVVTKDKKARFVLICGVPIKEPIVQHGPFVMNTQQEIYQAFSDFQTQSNGFEGAHKGL